MPPVMSQISDPKIAFAYLRPACVLLTRQPTVANVETLSSQLKEVNDATLQQLQEYVLFPLRFVLKIPGPKKDKLVQAVVEAMSYILENTCVRSWETLSDLLSELCLCVCSPTDPGKPAETSEELKAAVLRCLCALLHAAYGDIVFKLYEPVMLPGLGAAVSLMLALGEKEKSRDIQAAALKCLQALTLQCDCPLEHVSPSSEERCSVGTIMASFLPGITTAVTRIITGDLRQGHAVTVRAIKIWYRSVGLVMEDVQLQGRGSQMTPTADLGKIGQLVVHRTPDWVKNTAGRLCLLLKKVISCSSAHQHWRVRLETVELADHLLSSCSQSLRECVGPLLEALVGAINDDEPRVKERCEAALTDISQRNQSCSSQAFTEILSENLHSLATSLPRLMRTSDDQKKLFVLNVFLGYIKVLGPLVTVVLNSAAHLERISKALMQVLELDVMDVRIVEERNYGDAIESGAGSHDSRSTHMQRKHFLYFTDDRIFFVLMEICRTLGYYGNIYLLTDHLLDLYRQSSAYRKQAAMVLNEVIRGAAGIGVTTHCQGSEFEARTNCATKEDLKAAVLSVMEEYTSVNNWHLITASEETDRDRQDQKLLSPSGLFAISNQSCNANDNSLQLIASPPPSPSSSVVHQLNSNIWQLCIQLEGVACFAQALGRDFRPLLMTSLYPVLEKAGEETLLVSQAALHSMLDISQACGYASLKELINENSDYLLNDISLNLQRLGQHPQAPRVLTVMLTHSDCSMLPLVGDIVEDVLMALDLSYDHTAPIFCSVLHALMKALARWFPTSCSGTQSSTCFKQTSSNQEVFSARQFLLDYSKQKELAEGVGIEEDEETGDIEIPPPEESEDVEDIADPDVKVELPLHLKITKDVFERCVHLLSDPSLRLRLKVLDVLELCVHVLSQRENELLPLAHRCWPPLLQRLIADDPLAVLRAFRVLCTLGEACGDFLRRRVSKEVLPRLSASLARQAPISAKAGPVYTHTLAYKLQLAVLQGLGSLCQRLELGDADLDAVCEACLPYLSCRQPIRLQEACLSVFRHLIQVDPDAFWFTLSEVHCPDPHAPPHPDLLPVRLGGVGRPRDEYSDNVLKLLREEFGPTG